MAHGSSCNHDHRMGADGVAESYINVSEDKNASSFGTIPPFGVLSELYKSNLNTRL